MSAVPDLPKVSAPKLSKPSFPSAPKPKAPELPELKLDELKLPTPKSAEPKNLPDYSTAYHEFAVEYGNGRVQYAIDGQPYYTATQHGPAFDDFYVMLNTALMQDGSQWPKPINANTQFPVYHKIDYVRVAYPA